MTGSEAGIRLENRVPGADVNPYLAMAATLAGGMVGITGKLDAPRPVRTNAYELPESVAPRLPRSLDAAVELFSRSELARDWFGSEFVDDYVTMRRWECDRYHSIVTEWERERYFEMI